MKRKRVSGTAQTGDDHPQIMTLFTNDLPADAQYVSNTFALPISRTGSGSKTKSIVMEFLKIWWYPNIAGYADLSRAMGMAVSTANLRTTTEGFSFGTFETDCADPRVLGASIFSRSFSTNGGVNDWGMHETDLTDDAGRGILVATDSLHVFGGSIGNAVLGRIGVKILYRFVSVGVQEFVGIVQSQQ